MPAGCGTGDNKRAGSGPFVGRVGITAAMGTCNTILAETSCPRCSARVPVEVACRFGYTAEMFRFRIGDRYAWRPRKAVQNGGRPEGGDVDGEGYTDCPACGKDFFLKVIVRGDIIQAVEPDPAKQPYLPDDP
jgi:hypothetical protein